MRDFDWQIIVTLHHTENITKTAELLFISQPALTKRIKNIEDELGLTLLIRNRQGSFFTQEGEIIAQKAEHVVSAILDAREAAFARSSGVRTSIRLGFPYSFVRYVLPDILEQFVQKNPNVDVEIVTMSSPELIRGVEDGNVDVCPILCGRFRAGAAAVQRGSGLCSLQSSLSNGRFGEYAVYRLHKKPRLTVRSAAMVGRTLSNRAEHPIHHDDKRCLCINDQTRARIRVCSRFPVSHGRAGTVLHAVGVYGWD